jgi:two-component system alkaline phosphatase synthesis response regulator PhoP
MNKVLVVDDELAVQKICAIYLQAEGFTVKTLSTADHLLSEARAERPDVIVLDINLPGTDGFSAARAIKADKDTAGIPILILSARNDSQSRIKAVDHCRVEDYITKPFDPAELVRRLSQLCNRKK